jgi:predicted unusual protein kinase regulating ubiquinone biosynthesis (AarF/ABC1/UbiB family)
MGPVKYENVGKSQSVLMMLHPIIFTRTRIEGEIPLQEEIRATVERELGCALDEVFESFETKCLASASIAQVHSAVLRPEWAVAREKTGGGGGEPWVHVAVKVQHKDIAQTLAGDLITLSALLS